MKKLEALVPAAEAHDLLEELARLDVAHLVTSNVTVYDKHHSHKMTYRGCAYDDNSSHQVKIECSVADADFERAESLLAHTSAK